MVIPTLFRPANKLDDRLHADWIRRFCIAGEGCPRRDVRPFLKHVCKATGLDVTTMDVERTCPRRAELAARRHAENIARKKAAAAGWVHVAKIPDRAGNEENLATLIEAFPSFPPADHNDLF
jgi:hypothetical protein